MRVWFSGYAWVAGLRYYARVTPCMFLRAWNSETVGLLSGFLQGDDGGEGYERAGELWFWVEFPVFRVVI